MSLNSQLQTTPHVFFLWTRFKVQSLVSHLPSHFPSLLQHRAPSTEKRGVSGPQLVHLTFIRAPLSLHWEHGVSGPRLIHLTFISVPNCCCTSLWLCSQPLSLNFPFITQLSGKILVFAPSSVQSLSRVQLFVTHGLQSSRLPSYKQISRHFSRRIHVFCSLSAGCRAQSQRNFVKWLFSLASSAGLPFLGMSAFLVSTSPSGSLIPVCSVWNTVIGS